jgi:3-hydroxyacyl-[acyl-carrier-protein] dehydratase
MIFLDSFYTLNNIENDGENLTFHLTIDPAHAIFNGHFPGNPVTPGVVQIEMIKELLSLHYQRPIQLKSMSNCKFLSILNPEENKDIQVKIKQVATDEQGLKISGNIEANGLLFLKIQAEYGF